jgi:phosphate transport system ATP-binding protein
VIELKQPPFADIAIDLDDLSEDSMAGSDSQGPKLETQMLTLSYSGVMALENIQLSIPRNQVTACIGPSGCGKTTLLRCFNRMNDLIDDCEMTGRILLDGENINNQRVDVVSLRRKVGMVFQKPNPFPMSIYDNVAYGLRIQGTQYRRLLDEAVETALRASALWNEVKDRLDQPAGTLSGGQQQRLMIARAIAIQPEVLLLDEPASALDPISTLKVEELIHELRKRFTIVMVTHNMQQAARVSDFTVFMDQGRLIEFATTDRLFTNPKDKRTEDYITGRYS